MDELRACPGNGSVGFAIELKVLKKPFCGSIEPYGRTGSIHRPVQSGLRGSQRNLGAVNELKTGREALKIEAERFPGQNILDEAQRSSPRAGACAWAATSLRVVARFILA